MHVTAPVAYCLPGPLRSITVFSAGLLELLEPDELEAVVAHERAHVEQRHDIVLIAFRAWYASLPWFPIAYRAQRGPGGDGWPLPGMRRSSRTEWGRVGRT